ncbi:hypothetical protein QTP88_018896 [Uroleucon formosanum]
MSGYHCHVLLDSGSQHNFITEALAQQLRPKRTRTSCAVIGINESMHSASHAVDTNIKSRVPNYLSNLDFYVLPKLTTNLPSMPVAMSNLKLPAELALADPTFGTPQAIDIILGAEIFFDLIINEQLHPIPNRPVLQNTRLGWIIFGPEELVSIMARFRTHRYAIGVDIKKMYRQIWVTESQYDYQRILWRKNPDQPLNTYCLKTVTYGVITASYLPTVCLNKLLNDKAYRYPEACRALNQDFYVDDFLGGAASLSEALKLLDDLITCEKVIAESKTTSYANLSFDTDWVGYVKLAQLLNFWFQGESLDLKILKIDLQILANNLQNNGIDFKKIAILRWANFTNVKIKTRYHWPLMDKPIKANVTSCIHCQKSKPDKSNQVGKMLTYPIENRIPFSDVNLKGWVFSVYRGIIGSGDRVPTTVLHSGWVPQPTIG